MCILLIQTLLLLRSNLTSHTPNTLPLHSLTLLKYLQCEVSRCANDIIILQSQFLLPAAVWFQLFICQPLATCTAAGPSFTEEQICHYETRYEEGYDIAEDQDYINWLRLNHPDSLKGRKNQVETREVGLCDASITQHFRDLSPLEQISFGDSPDSPAAVPQSSQSTPSTSRTPVSTLQSIQSTPSTSRTPVSALQSSQSTPSTSLSRYLSPPQSTPSLKGKEPPRAHLLTSASAVESMLEKERKKQEETELKKRRRKEREEAKKKKEEQRRKSEERAKKAELKAKQKEEERARKAEEKVKSKVSTGRK